MVVVEPDVSLIDGFLFVDHDGPGLDTVESSLLDRIVKELVALFLLDFKVENLGLDRGRDRSIDDGLTLIGLAADLRL